MKQLIVLTILILGCNYIKAQTTSPQILSVNLQLTGAASDAAYNEITVTGVDTFLVQVEVLLSDTAAVNKLHLSMVSTASRSTTYLSNAFTVQGSQAVPVGTAYNRNGNIVSINLGKYWGAKEYRLLAKEEYSGGQMSVEVEY